MQILFTHGSKREKRKEGAGAIDPCYGQVIGSACKGEIKLRDPT